MKKISVLCLILSFMIVFTACKRYDDDLIKSDETTVGESDETTVGESDETTVGESDETTVGESDETTVGESDETTIGGSDETTIGGSDETTAGGSDETTAGGSDETTAGGSDETTAGDSDETTAGESEETTENSSSDENELIQQASCTDVRTIACFDTLNEKVFTGKPNMTFHKQGTSAWTHSVANADGMMVGDDGLLTLNGWALINGGQQALYWSLDKNTWHKFEGGRYFDAEDAVITAATNDGKLTIVSRANARFAGITADLSAYCGQKITLYVAVYGNGLMVDILTLDNLKVGTQSCETRLYSLQPIPGVLMNSFVIRTETGKLIVMDGGIDVTGVGNISASTPAYLPSALRAIAGVGENGYVEIEAWILTHAHKDHIYEMVKTLNEYSDDPNFVVNQIIFDFPEFETAAYPAANSDQVYVDMLKSALATYASTKGIAVKTGSTYYDDLNGAYANAESIAAGLELTVDNVCLEFMQTWAVSDGANINNNSLVVRAWVDGQSILFLGDTYVERGNTLLEKYGDSLKSDIVQMSHHGQNGVTREVYEAIDATVRIWPTPNWVWNNVDTYQIDDTRKWFNNGVDFFTSSRYDIVTCLYAAYPTVINDVDSWYDVIDGMYIALPYDPSPAEHGYVSEGLVSMYQGGTGSKWTDAVGANDIIVSENSTRTLTEEGLYLNGAAQTFSQNIVNVINGDEFTVEITMKNFKPSGTTYNTLMCSNNDKFALFRQCDGVNDFVTFKWAGKASTYRPISANGMLAKLQNDPVTVTVTFKNGGATTIYINGVQVAMYSGVDATMSADTLQLGHADSAKKFSALFTSVRFYNVALTASQIAANAAVDAGQ